jgi:lysophospholipase L1-like esterase
MADYSIEVSIPNQGPEGPPSTWVTLSGKPNLSAAMPFPKIAKSIVNAYRNNIVANSGTISDKHLEVLSQALEPIVSTSLWPKIKELWVPLGNNLAAALVKLKYPSSLSAVLTQDNIVEADYNPMVGITGGTNRRINSDFNPSQHLATASAGVGIFSFSETFASNSVLGGAKTTNNYFLHFSFGDGGGNSLIGGIQRAHDTGRGLCWMQFRNGNVEFGSGARTVVSEPATPAAMSGTFSVFTTLNGFYSNATVGGYAFFDGLTTAEISALNLFFRRVNDGIGRDAFNPSINLIGDSITDGDGASSAATRWGNIFANRYGLTALNQGIGGATLKSPPYPAFAVYPINRNLHNRPSVFHIIFIGTNDAYNFDAPSTHLQDFETAYRAMLQTLINNGINLKTQVILVSPSWPADAALINGVTRQRYEQYVAKVAEIAAEFGAPYVDAYATILAAGGTSALADQIHPNDTGHAALAAAISAVFEQRASTLTVRGGGSLELQ